MRRAVRLLPWAVPLLFLALFFAYPVATLLGTAAGRGRAVDSAGLSVGVLTEVVAFTVYQAVLSTALTVAIALPGCWVLARFAFPGRRLVEALAVVAFVMPTVVVATAVSATLGDDGPLAWLLPERADRGLGAILAAHVYFNLAVVLRMVGSYWAQLDRRPAEAAASLGAPPWRVFTAVTLPALRPALLASAAIVFLFTLTSFGVVLLLGGPGQATIEVEIQRQVLFLFDLRAGAVLSLLQIGMVLVLLLVQTRLTARLARGGGGRELLRVPRSAGERVAVAGFVVAGLLVLAGPVAMVVVRALRTESGWGWEAFRALATTREGSVLFVPPVEAVLNSLVYAATATLIAVIIGGLAAVAIARRVRPGGLWEGIWLLPLGVSAVTLGFGILVAFDAPPLSWRGGFWMVPIAQALVAIPFVVRALVPALHAVGPRVREAAAALGASPGRVLLHVDLPLVSRALAVAVGFAFAISLGEFGATVFVARADRPTVPIAIYRMLGAPGAALQAQAMAMASLLIVLTAAAVLATDWLRAPGERHV